MEEVDKEISETRLSLNARARIVAESYLATVSRAGYFLAVPLIRSLSSNAHNAYSLGEHAWRITRSSSTSIEWQPNKINSSELGTMRRKGCLKRKL